MKEKVEPVPTIEKKSMQNTSPEKWSKKWLLWSVKMTTSHFRYGGYI